MKDTKDITLETWAARGDTWQWLQVAGWVCSAAPDAQEELDRLYQARRPIQLP